MIGFALFKTCLNRLRLVVPFALLNTSLNHGLQVRIELGCFVVPNQGLDSFKVQSLAARAWILKSDKRRHLRTLCHGLSAVTVKLFVFFKTCEPHLEP